MGSPHRQPHVGPPLLQVRPHVSVSEPSGQVEALLGPPSSQTQLTLPFLPLCTAVGQQTPLTSERPGAGGAWAGL